MEVDLQNLEVREGVDRGSLKRSSGGSTQYDMHIL